ncbi:hypothetical protein [Methylobacterium sp. WCS2018Hpa-22]|uniref:hypothetical protein n=1 Tax=Methylobacterium sp. WCS2018Hpa-22 TaxID=3073633 RepID=UPI00288B9AD3|nr:hypothetical protein [Methylobacterium sp. WCS2018Hpa-22]
MSKKLGRATAHWGAKGGRRRRHVRAHVRKASGHTFWLVMLGVPACVYLLYCLCRIGGETHFHLMPVGSPHIENGSPLGDRASTTRRPASEPH